MLVARGGRESPQGLNVAIYANVSSTFEAGHSADSCLGVLQPMTKRYDSGWNMFYLAGRSALN